MLASLNVAAAAAFALHRPFEQRFGTALVPFWEPPACRKMPPNAARCGLARRSDVFCFCLSGAAD
jgi:hypothetical protein